MLPRSLTCLSCDRASSIEADDLAGDIGTFGREEMNEARDVLRRAGAGERDTLEILLLLGERIAGGPFDDAGGDAVDGDFGRELARQAEREVRERGFARAVGEELGPGSLGEEVAHVD